MSRRPAAAQTAFGPMVVAACEQYLPPAQRLLDDQLAARFLPTGQRLHKRMTRTYDVWRFGLAPHEVGPLLQQYGWTEREQVGGAEYRTRYLDPIRRRLPTSDVELAVVARKND